MALVALFVLLLAPAALAQRDPFLPLVRPEGAAAGGTARGAPSAPAAPAQPGPPAMPTTGFEAEPYLALAITLLSLGGGLVVMARLRSRPLT